MIFLINKTARPAASRGADCFVLCFCTAFAWALVRVAACRAAFAWAHVRIAACRARPRADEPLCAPRPAALRADGCRGAQFLRRDAEGGFEPLDEVAYAVVAQRHGDVQNAFLAGLQQRQRVIEFQIVKIFKQR